MSAPQRRRRNRGRVLLLSLLALSILLAACGQERPGLDEPSPRASPSPTGQIRDYHGFGAPSPVGSGILQGMSLDGSAAYVSDTDKAFPEPGCEGQPESVMFRQPLSGGERTRLGDGKSPVKGEVVRGPDGLVALVRVCEEFFNGLAIGRESPDGQITDLREVKLTQTEGDGNPAAFSFSWTPDGKALLAAINDPLGPDGKPSTLVSIDPATGAMSRLFDGEGGSGVFQFAKLEGGTYVVSSNRVVTFRDAGGRITASFPGNGFEVFPDRSRVVVYGPALAVATEGSREAKTIAAERPDHEISSARISPDGEAVAFNRYSLQGSTNEIAVATVDDGKTSSVVSGEGYGEPFFSGDGRSLGFNRFTREPEFLAQVLVASLDG
jgi:hypothetical protein